METTPMSYIVEITWEEWHNHSLHLIWDQLSHIAAYEDEESYPLFLKQEYSISVVDERWMFPERSDGEYPGHMRLEFESAQDYILWKLHQ